MLVRPPGLCLPRWCSRGLWKRGTPRGLRSSTLRRTAGVGLGLLQSAESAVEPFVRNVLQLLGVLELVFNHLVEVITGMPLFDASICNAKVAHSEHIMAVIPQFLGGKQRSLVYHVGILQVHRVLRCT